MSVTNLDADPSDQPGAQGYVYILRVKSIDLPVCKIGRTSRTPDIRCAEINKSSTGDFLWSVEHQIAVSDCKQLEGLVHSDLFSKRQIGREIFGLKPDEAMVRVQSILNATPDLQVLEIVHPAPKAPARKRESTNASAVPRERELEFSHLLYRFNEKLQVKGVTFGQLNKSSFGISDGQHGVQWNLAVFPKEDRARVGVNLEGLMYEGWPIATLIQSELQAPRLLEVASRLSDAQDIHVRFARDAWQGPSRLSIVEEYLGGHEFRLSELTADAWLTMLEEAFGCLDKTKDHRARAVQEVHLSSAPQKGARTVQVSPHLTIWTPIDPSSHAPENLTRAIDRLTPIHQWALKASTQAA